MFQLLGVIKSLPYCQQNWLPQMSHFERILYYLKMQNWNNNLIPILKMVFITFIMALFHYFTFSCRYIHWKNGIFSWLTFQVFDHFLFIFFLSIALYLLGRCFFSATTVLITSRSWGLWCQHSRYHAGEVRYETLTAPSRSLTTPNV